jgi:hypothetical protein
MIIYWFAARVRKGAQQVRNKIRDQLHEEFFNRIKANEFGDPMFLLITLIDDSASPSVNKGECQHWNHPLLPPILNFLVSKFEGWTAGPMPRPTLYTGLGSVSSLIILYLINY